MWLLKEDLFKAMEAARRAGLTVTAAQCVEHAKNSEPSAEGIPRNLKVAGDVAEIRVEGVLTKKPDFWSWLFGGGNTTYEQIQQALAICAADTSIKRVRFYVDSPGGHVDGLFDTLAAIDAFPKPKSVTAAFACSAAYAIAAVAGKIEATNEAVEVGSIGVAVRYVSYSDVENIDITSTEAPDKRPDPKTEEGRAVIRKTLDDIHDLFVDAIAHGRGTTTDLVNANFGRGATLLAAEAKKRKMIDRIAKPALRAIEPSTDPAEPDPIESSAVSGGRTETIPMTIEELKKAHPELCSALLSEGEQAGVTKERKRVNAHLKLGTSSGDMKLAHDSIASGVSAMDEEVFAAYQSAAMNRRDQGNRQADSNAAGAALGGAKPAVETAGEKDLGDRVADAMRLPQVTA